MPPKKRTWFNKPDQRPNSPSDNEVNNTDYSNDRPSSVSNSLSKAAKSPKPKPSKKSSRTSLKNGFHKQPHSISGFYQSKFFRSYNEPPSTNFDNNRRSILDVLDLQSPVTPSEAAAPRPRQPRKRTRSRPTPLLVQPIPMISDGMLNKRRHSLSVTEYQTLGEIYGWDLTNGVVVLPKKLPHKKDSSTNLARKELEWWNKYQKQVEEKKRRLRQYQEFTRSTKGSPSSPGMSQQAAQSSDDSRCGGIHELNSFVNQNRRDILTDPRFIDTLHTQTIWTITSDDANSPQESAANSPTEIDFIPKKYRLSTGDSPESTSRAPIPSATSKSTPTDLSPAGVETVNNKPQTLQENEPIQPDEIDTFSLSELANSSYMKIFDMSDSPNNINFDLVGDNGTLSRRNSKSELEFDDNATVNNEESSDSAIIMSATAAKLVEKLTSSVDYEFLSDFFLVYRKFMSPMLLAQLMAIRILSALPSGNDDNDDKRIIRVRCFVVLRHWFSNYFDPDFTASRPLRKYMLRFLKSLSTLPQLKDNSMDARIVKNLKAIWKSSITNYVKERNLAAEVGDTENAVAGFGTEMVQMATPEPDRLIRDSGYVDSVLPSNVRALDGVESSSDTTSPSSEANPSTTAGAAKEVVFEQDNSDVDEPSRLSQLSAESETNVTVESARNLAADSIESPSASSSARQSLENKSHGFDFNDYVSLSTETPSLELNSLPDVSCPETSDSSVEDTKRSKRLSRSLSVLFPRKTVLKRRSLSSLHDIREAHPTYNPHQRTHSGDCCRASTLSLLDEGVKIKVGELEIDSDAVGSCCEETNEDRVVDESQAVRKPALKKVKNVVKKILSLLTLRRKGKSKKHDREKSTESPEFQQSDIVSIVPVSPLTPGSQSTTTLVSDSSTQPLSSPTSFPGVPIQNKKTTLIRHVNKRLSLFTLTRQQSLYQNPTLNSSTSSVNRSSALSRVNSSQRKSGKPFILTAKSAVIAQHLSVIEQENVKNIKWKDLVMARKDEVSTDKKWRWGCSNETNPNDAEISHEEDAVCRVIERFNLTCQWVATQVLMASNLSTRVKIVEKFIKIAAKCLEYNNFSSLMSIVLGLQSRPVDRLHLTWSKVSNEKQNLFTYLQEFTSPFKNFKHIRQTMGSVAKDEYAKGVPFLGIYLSDLTFNGELPNTVFPPPLFDSRLSTDSAVTLPVKSVHWSPDLQRATKELINWHKFRNIARIVRKVQLFQHNEKMYDEFQLDLRIWSRCLFLEKDVVESEELEKWSEELERRTK
ncbi:ras guanine nucleotide exchange factor domain-containing protein [Paraphysoderma sedebokerense]|nr:ras guanine nucleotide exchange factor domain-containing protein [Paraphysoderma sedebokerense]